MDWTQILVSILGGGGFLGGIVSLVNMKPSRKKAMAEARTVEITNLEKSISIMEKSYSNIQTYVNKEVTRIENDLSELKKKYEEKVISIRQAYICKVSSEECPVLLKQAKFDMAHECEECRGCEKNEKKED